MRRAEATIRGRARPEDGDSNGDFPQMAVALNPEMMRHVFQRNVYAGNASTLVPACEVISCAIDEIRYKPNQSCVISYRLQVIDPAFGTEGHQILTVRLRGEPDITAAKSSKPRKLTTPTQEINDPAMSVWMFPQDRKLTHLPELFNIDRVRNYLDGKLAGKALAYGGRVSAAVPTVIHYLPERSCIVKYDLTLEQGEDKGYTSLTVFVKNYFDDQGRYTFAAMQALNADWGHGAEPLAYDADTHSLWQYSVPGQPLTWALLRQADSERIIRRIASCTAQFHASQVTCHRSYTTDAIVADLMETLTVSQTFNATVAERVSDLVERLARRKEQIVRREGTHLLHRDLKLFNFMLGEQALHLIDLDTLAHGERLSDVGSFLANLHLCSLRAGDDPVRCQSLVAAFMESYECTTTSSPRDWRWQWYTAAALIHEVVRRSLRQQNPERLELLDDFLDLAEGYIEEVEQAHWVQTVSSLLTTPSVPMMEVPPEFRICLDAEKMCNILAQHLPECVAGSWRITGCHIENPRYKSFLRAESRAKSFFNAVYRLTGVRVDTGVKDTRLFVISAYLGDRAHREYQQLETTGANSIGYIRELGLIYQRFPSDPAMPWLRLLTDPAQGLDRLPLSQTDRDRYGALGRIEVVNYRPTIRCTLRYDCNALDDEPVASLYAKTYAEPVASDVFDRITQVYAVRETPGSFTTGRPVYVDPGMNCVWQESLDGRSISPLDAERAEIKSIAIGLARLHELTMPALPELTQESYLQEALKKLDKLQRLMPPFVDQLASLTRWLVTEQAAATVSRTLHGDFHLAQLLKVGDRIAVFDFDEFQHGDPLIDLANFLADVYYKAGSCAGQRWQTVLLPAYSSSVQWPINPHAFFWHLAIQHITRAYRTLVQQQQKRHERVAAALAAAFRTRQVAERRTASAFMSMQPVRRSP